MSLHRKLKTAVIVLGAGLLTISINSGGGKPEYVGQGKCKTCHLKQHKVLRAAKHANAMKSLPKEERSNPDCLACHTTGYGQPAAAGAKLEGVQCEACHVPGSLYISMMLMRTNLYKADPAAAHQKSVESGLLVPDEGTCRQCHNAKSPNFKGFEADTFMEKIKHWN